MDNSIQNFYQLGKAKGFKVLHLNIRSLLKKIDQLRVILEPSNIDIFTISETWLHPKIENHLINVQGYTAYRLDRGHCITTKKGLTTKRGGGLLTYFRTDSLDVYVQEAECLTTKDIEIQWFKVKRKNAKTITLANVYRPPAGKINLAIKALEEGLSALAAPNEEIIILGDLNIDYKNQKSPNFKKIKFFEQANSLEQKICTTTRNSKTSSSILDIALTNMKYIQHAGTLDSFLSDHQPIFLVKKKERNVGKAEQIFEGRSYRNYDKQKFIDNILAQKWTYFYETQDPEKAWEEMQSIIIREADKQCPIRTYKIKNNKPCWLTNEILEQMKDRDYFYRKAKMYNNEDDWNIAKFYRNQTNFNVRKAKADYIKEQLKNNEGNSAKFWRLIKQVIPSKKGVTNHPKITITNKDEELVADGLVANFMNAYFAGLGNNNNKQNNTNKDPPPFSPSHSSQTDLSTPPDADPTTEGNVNSTVDDTDDTEYFHFSQIINVEVESLVNRINISKSSGIHQLSSKLLKDSFKVLIDKLTYLFNLSITTTTFPVQWKKALVIPIPKTPNPHTVENFRPISLLPLPGKILEKLIHKQLSYHLEDHDYLSDSQFGFRKQRSTTHAVSQLLNQIYTNINRSVITAAVYIDFSKAFNCVQHSTLLKKLMEYRIGQEAISWLESYLESREQRTLVNNDYSQWLPVPQGVPQGSVLGPLLYIIYSNDIAQKIKNSGFTFYADDTVLYSKKKSITQAGTDLQEDLNSLNVWCLENDIFINSSKTKSMFFGSRAKIESMGMPKLYIDGTLIDRTKTYTYLGIKLDEQLSLETHANIIIKRVTNKIYQLTKMRPFLTKKAALLTYKNMILPILEFGDVFLHSAPNKIRKKLQVLQNKALRCALSKKRSHSTYSTDDLHLEAKILKLKQRRHVHVLLHMYQLAHLPGFKLWKKHQSTGVRTRSSKKKLISSRKPNNEKFKKSITYQGPKLWNSLPAHLQKMESYQEFKKEIHKLSQPQQVQQSLQTKTKSTTKSTTRSKSKSKKSKSKSKPKIKT